MAILLNKKYSLREIARIIKRSISALSDEIKVNSVNGEYDPKKADHKAYTTRKYAKYQAMKIIENRGLWDFVEKKLIEGHSPENIAGRIKRREKHLPSINKDIVYKFLASPYGEQARIQIRKIKQNQKRKRRKKKNKYLNNKNKKTIENRTLFSTNRRRIGHAEADFIVSGRNGKGILLVVVDRKSRAAFLELIINISIANVHIAFQKIKKRFPEMTTITTDNDILLQKYENLEKELDVKIYFCHPYHAWEKGTVENINKEIRKYVPKGDDISKYSSRFIRQIEEKLNNRIMKCLDYFTPQEVLSASRKRKNRLSGFKNKCSD